MWRSTALEREGQAELFLFERAIHVGIGEDEQCTYNAAGPRFLNVFFSQRFSRIEKIYYRERLLEFCAYVCLRKAPIHDIDIL
jgi:hypothetical protein